MTHPHAWVHGQGADAALIFGCGGDANDGGRGDQHGPLLGRLLLSIAGIRLQLGQAPDERAVLRDLNGGDQRPPLPLRAGVAVAGTGLREQACGDGLLAGTTGGCHRLRGQCALVGGAGVERVEVLGDLSRRTGRQLGQLKDGLIPLAGLLGSRQERGRGEE